MELKGKKIVFLGDSITEGHGVAGPDKTYWSVLGQRTGALCTADGIGGTRIAQQQHRLEATARHDDNPFFSRVEALDADADIVVVFGGTNDYGHGDAAMGNFEDRTVDTFYGACHDLCLRLLNKYPSAIIVFMTPLHRLQEDTYRNVRANEVRHLSDFVRAIREVAEYYSLPVLDLFRVAGIQPSIEGQRTLFMPDGLHPNEAGHQRIADRLIAFLNTLA